MSRRTDWTEARAEEETEARAEEDTQRAMIAAEIANLPRGTNRFTVGPPDDGSTPAPTQEQVRQQMQVSDGSPSLRHARWCSEPAARRSDLPLDRGRTRWRCPECGAQAIVTEGSR